MSTNCTGGNSPDGLLRLAMPVGPFDQPYGQDCFFNLVTYQALAGIAIAVNLLVFAMALVDLLPRGRSDWALTLGSIALVISCAAHVAFLLCGLYAPWACRALWPVCWAGFAFYVNAYLWKLVSSGLRVQASLNSKASTFADVFGGKWRVRMLAGTMLLSSVLIVLGAAVSAALYRPEDERAALVGMQIHFVAIATWSLGVFVTQDTFSTQFVREVDSIVQSAAPLRSPTAPAAAAVKDSDQTAAAAVRVTSDEVQAMLFRFRFCLRCGPLAVPITILMNPLLAFVLPFTYYLVLLQIFNSVFVGFVGWFGLAPTKRRLRVWRILSCGLVGGDETGESSAPSSPNGSRLGVLVVAPGSPQLSHTGGGTV